MPKAAVHLPLRRSTRINVRIPVRISGNFPDGAPFTEETFVVTVSKFGAKIKTRLPLQAGIELRVKPQMRREGGLFRVVWMGTEGTLRAGEAGIEYVRVTTLLGVSFPE